MWLDANDRKVAQDRRLLIAVLGALVALAWGVLWAWGRSPDGRLLSHELLAQGGKRGTPEGAVLALVFVSGWTLMTVAMMLPTSLPLVGLFHSLVRGRPHRARLVALLVAGYLGVWTLFGAIAHAGDFALHRLVEQLPWLQARPWAVGASVLVLAGVYQFTPLKDRCLDQCRSPLSFITQHWRGRDEAWQSFTLGLHHGLFCLGCCWSLMLLMFAVGVGNLGWMLLLGAVMAVEKNVSWGKRISRPLGFALVGSGAAAVLSAWPIA
jgi:predicted metal-binding membrane protein